MEDRLLAAGARLLPSIVCAAAAAAAAGARAMMLWVGLSCWFLDAVVTAVLFVAPLWLPGCKLAAARLSALSDLGDCCQLVA